MNTVYGEERIIAHLKAAQCASIKDVVGELGLNRRTAWLALDSLKRQGLVAFRHERPVKPAPLVRVYYLTPLGRECAPIENPVAGQTRLGAEA